jgi:anaerobic C4-dicarboxylate transporter
MKKIITCFALLIMANSIYSQQNNPTAPLTRKDYLQKSKNQKTAAWCFMGGGLVITTLGVTNNTDKNFNSGNTTGRVAGIVTGLVAMSVGTVLFVAATKNKIRAESLSFRMEKVPLIRQKSLVSGSYPALSFRINF